MYNNKPAINHVSPQLAQKDPAYYRCCSVYYNITWLSECLYREYQVRKCQQKNIIRFRHDATSISDSNQLTPGNKGRQLTLSDISNQQ